MSMTRSRNAFNTSWTGAIMVEKHYESVWTRFYQGYILPEKFGIDKRKAHLSNLIFSGQLTKEEALEKLNQPIYPPELSRKTRNFVIKKLGLNQAQFNDIMNLPRKKHTDFATAGTVWEQYPLQLGKPIYDLRVVGNELSNELTPNPVAHRSISRPNHPTSRPTSLIRCLGSTWRSGLIPVFLASPCGR